jgi:hypothetical protein
VSDSAIDLVFGMGVRRCCARQMGSRQDVYTLRGTIVADFEIKAVLLISPWYSLLLRSQKAFW